MNTNKIVRNNLLIVNDIIIDGVIILALIYNLRIKDENNVV
jgi:hypothetical protein